MSELCEVCGENEATHYCATCEQKIQCENCCKFLHQTKKRADHKIEDYSEYKKKNVIKKCKTHPSEQIILFCTNCFELVCISCVSSNHAGHKCVQFEDGLKAIISSLQEKHIKAEERLQDYSKIVKTNELSYKEIQESYQRCQNSIINGFKELRELLEKKEKELLDSIDETEQPKMEKFSNEIEKGKNAEVKIKELAEQLRLTIESTPETIDCLEQLIVISTDYEKHIFSQKIEEFPSIDPPIDKILDSRSLEKSVNSIILNYVIDVTSSSILPETTPYALLGSDLKFSAVLKGIQGRMNPLKGHSLSLEIVEKPSGSVPTIITQETEAQINITLKADKDGVYLLRAHSFGKDIKGSPLRINIYPVIEEVFEAPEKIHTGGGFNPLVKEIWIKGKEKIHTFNMKGVPIRVVDLPMITISFDEEGNTYGGDGEKHFYRYDKNNREKWQVYPAEGKTTAAACSDGVIVYGVYKEGPLLLLNRETGFTIEIVDIEGLENVTSIVVWEDFLMMADNGNIKIFSKKGKFVKQAEDIKNIQSLTVINRMVYACKEKSNTWYKIITPRSLKDNQETQKSSKLSKYPSMVLSPRISDVIHTPESIPLQKQGSSLQKVFKK